MLRPYDVFISYNRNDRDWVLQHLYLPLKGCRRKDEQELRIFFDDDVLETGDLWRESLATALRDCTHFIPVYSKDYFLSDFCRWELDLAHGRDIRNTKQLLLPVCIDCCEVPFVYTAIQYTTVARTDWFLRLCARMQLTPGPLRNQSERSTQPGAPFPEVTTQLHQDLLAELRQLVAQRPAAFEIRVTMASGEYSSPRTRDILMLPRRTMHTQHVGDALVLSLASMQDCYVYVFDIGTTGKITLLFPNPFAREHRLQAGIPKLIPAFDAPYDFRLSGPPGIEVIQVFGLDQPVEYTHYAEVLPTSVDSISIPRLLRDVQIIAHTAVGGDAKLKVAWSQIEFAVAVKTDSSAWKISDSPGFSGKTTSC